MSSPATFYGPPSSPPIPPSLGLEEDDENSIPTGRPMRVKVSYTFDDENKTNCLARFPDVLNIPTVAIDNSTQIGIVELKKCIKAIVAASPELIAKLGQDYTVYAYDYSEYETPLVGQGMLSRLLASASSTPDAPAHQSSTMITGRVCKNIIGLFSNGIKETLDVRLRLVPVPTCKQSEYLASLEQYRNVSVMQPSVLTSSTLDADIGQAPSSVGATYAPPFDQRTGGIEDIHHLLTQGYDLQGNHALPQDNYAPMSDAGYSTQASRAGSPTPSQRSIAPSQAQSRYPPPRPSSRASQSNSRVPYSRKESSSFLEQGDVPDADQSQEPARKKARIMKADWKGKSSALGSADSLRVTASTANSIRVHRPAPIRPSGDRTHSLEPPPRAPTPIPEAGPRSRPLLRAASASLLRRGSTLSSDGNYASPYSPNEDREQSQPAWAFSPQDENQISVNTSPLDIPSSPPEFAPPSSPPLPTYPPDSGFMSEAAPDRPDEDDEERPVDEEDMVVAQRWKKRPRTMRPDKDGFCAVIPGPLELLPQRMPEKLRELDRQRRLQQEGNAEKAQDSDRPSPVQQPKRGPTPTAMDIRPPPGRRPSASSLVLPTSRPATEEVSSDRANDVKGPSNNETDSSEAQDKPLAQVATEEAPTERNSSSAAASRRRIANRLAESLAKGQSPPYCQNCGEINTPTWRTAFCKIQDGELPKATYSNEKGGIVALQSLDQDAHGKTTRHMIIKKLVDDRIETDYHPFQLCNPCGLWLNKHKGMRPQKVWHKSSTDRRRREFLKKMRQAGSVEPQSDFGPTTTSTLETDQVSPAETSHVQQTLEEPPSREGPTDKRRENSTDRIGKSGVSSLTWDDTFAAAALKRAIQSSPARLLGSQQSPIEVTDDLTPKPTRRLLFPSPRREGEMKTLDGDHTTASSHSSKPTATNTNGKPLVLVDDVQNDKENCPPPLNVNDDLDVIFQDINFPLAKTPEKKTPSPADRNRIFKTPTPSSRRSKLPLTPSQHLLSSATRALRSTPASARASASKLLHTLLSPSRSSPQQQQQQQQLLTPFTTQLNQLLSDSLASPSARSSTGSSGLARVTGAFDLEALPELGFNADAFGALVGDAMGGGGAFDAEFWSTDPLGPVGEGGHAMRSAFGVYEDPSADCIVSGEDDDDSREGRGQGWDAESLFGKSPGTGLKSDGLGELGKADGLRNSGGAEASVVSAMET
ncbi:MAG: hypothetical protein M1821_000116 [Bathelium mastoideum]|nr:MAG: hypothetical protein M1821_000116 [Bathelium mastoideum]